MRAVDIGEKTDPVPDIDAQIVEMRTKISKAYTSYRAEYSAIQNEIERWDRKYRTLLKGSFWVLQLMSRACAFAGKCQALADRLGCSVFICQDVEAVLAAQLLRSDNAIIVLDLVEPPSYRMRGERLDGPLDPLVHALDRARSGLLSLADIVVVASAALAAELLKAGLTTTVMPDYEAALPTHLRGAGRIAMLRTERPANGQRSRQIAATLLAHGVDLTIVTAQPRAGRDDSGAPPVPIIGATCIEIPVDV
ncbi:MAG TPA: hypothetical protein VGS13_15330 [Stellaceae bacterium]|nr:hypothetical protein [Stellaceae bacterium]